MIFRKILREIGEREYRWRYRGREGRGDIDGDVGGEWGVVIYMEI